ncbi:2Fe-2S iron-sulfur cluster-binding protein [Marinoscillum furvescens]|uniref:Ring-1,2-phenylacetyl-CoA epoxidase subunit PaaE n=1 Tax=Marinoscillum furvescens DSM 4134 TaxID=1122208 RepID=A0A3D9LKN0_MARFU|nr:2Fe-2S iron-sulfur cluster-binding protein [Marinoscillum furvescens]REE05812.1 ring-1,2-phenylacetyl-CoA epoxidase subunit PaaE [Marinoscillum furvescens DSM 4134]
MAFGLFKKKKKEKKTDERYQTLTIREVVHVATDAVNLVFEKPTGDFSYKPGQFITIIREIQGKKVRRAYSLCTTPFADEYPAVTVKRVPGGIMSNHVADTFKAGDQIEIMEPMGMFTTEYQAGASRHAVFFGGGSGVTPLYSILRSVLLKEPNSRVSLVYGNRSEEYIIFKDQLNQLVAEYGGRFELVHVLEEDASGLAAFTGRPTVEMIGQIADKLKVTPETEFYICGPEPMMNITSEGLSAIGIKDEKVRKESFEAGKTSPSVIVDGGEGASASGASEVTILMDGEEYVVQVDRNTPILDAGLDKEIDMPYSCQSGLCTACRAKCLEGEVDQEGAEGLSQEEYDDGYVLLCVGKPKSEKVKVEVG